MPRYLVLIVVLLTLAAGFMVAADWWPTLEGRTAQYVGRQKCAGCHDPQIALWKTSDHAQAMDYARADTVLGDFDDQKFTHFDVISTMFRRDQKYYMNTDGPEGKLQDFEIKYVFGFYPLQQYLVEFPDGRVQCLPVAWDTSKKEWFHLYPGESLRSDDPLHWTKPLQNWNYMCADCHSTDLKKNYDLATNSYHTTWSEINVSCETCHGPGSVHVELAQKWFFWDRRIGMGLPKLKGPDNLPQIDTCAPCHARRRIVYPGFEGGDHFLDHYLPELIDNNLYYADGQILDEDYEYTSFRQSKMFHKSVRCTDCHDAHSMHVKFTQSDAQGRYHIKDNKVCGQCHVPTTYDTPKHHHHPDSSKPGWLCVECHMPTTNYMVVDPRLDHSIRIPRPDLTVSLGIPNACNRCHNDPAKDETAQWAVDKCLEWYGEKNEPQHFAYAIAAGRDMKPEGEKMLDAVTRRQDLSAIVRASAISLLSRYRSRTGIADATRGLQDPDAIVRAASVRSLDNAPPEELARQLRPMLFDPRTALRAEAARVLSNVPSDSFTPEDRRAFDAALAECMDGLKSVDDQPGAHLSMGIIDHNLGQTAKAVAEYETALRLDPTFLPARINLAMLRDQLGAKDEAMAEFRRVIESAAKRQQSAAEQASELPQVQKKFAETSPQSPEITKLRSRLTALQGLAQEAQEMSQILAQAHYSLGLLLAEDEKRLGEAAVELAEAVKLSPDNPRMHYNYGLALQKLNRPKEAEEQLRRAYEIAPSVPDYLYALTILYIQQKQWTRATACAEELVRQMPDNQQMTALLVHIKGLAEKEKQKPAAKP